MSRAQWTEEAQLDLAGVDDYYNELNPLYAVRVGRAALAAGRFLAKQPQAGPRVLGETRKWRVAGTPYVLIYRPVTDGVEILRLHHGRQNWKPRTR